MRILDPFRSERETFFQVNRRGPRSTTISVALPHVLALMVLVSILVMVLYQ